MQPANRRRIARLAVVAALVAMIVPGVVVARRWSYYRRQADHFRGMAEAKVSFTADGLTPEQIARESAGIRRSRERNDLMRRKYEWAASHPWVSDPAGP